MICPICLYNIKDKGGNRKKSGGVWVHKKCPDRKSYRRLHTEKLKQER